MEIRPWADVQEVLPPLGLPEKEALRQSILADGIQQPILVLPDGRIIDGHHRWQLKGKWECPFEVSHVSEAKAFDLAIELNIARRQLSREQLTQIREEQARRREEAKRIALQMCEEGATQQKAADAVGIDQATVSRAQSNRNIMQEDDMHNASEPLPDNRVKIPVSEHSTIFERYDAGETQAQIAADYQVTQRTISGIVAREKDRKERAANELQFKPVRVGYQTIVIDPPWPIEKIARDVRPNQQGFDYPTMTVDEIAKIPIRKLAGTTDGGSSCHVYLWVTQKYLPAGLGLFEEWGVKYECVMTWIKPTGMTPFSWMYNTEHVLFGRIGHQPLQRKGLKLSFDAPVTKHSEKPEVFYERVVEASPAPRLEMFARKMREGFDVWGDEV